MRPLRVMIVAGARPQFIKASVLFRALTDEAGITPSLLHSGQHYDDELSSVFFRELGIPPAVGNLEVGSLSHGAQTGQMLERIEQVLVREAPDHVIVIGDTNTTLAGALAASKLGLALSHVEAGLRSFDRRMPEEINRVVADHVATLLFAPTEAAVANLSREGIFAGVSRVGDVLYDAALLFADRAQGESGILQRLGVKRKGYVLATVHRAASTDDAVTLAAIAGALSRVSDAIDVVLPLHPRTRAALEREGLLAALQARVLVIEPVGFLHMMSLVSGARHVATDSGGLQKEAYFFRVPCTTLRAETEWVELVEAGWNRLSPPTDEVGVAARILDHIEDGPPPDVGDRRLYGDGDAARKISARIKEFHR